MWLICPHPSLCFFKIKKISCQIYQIYLHFLFLHLILRNIYYPKSDDPLLYFLAKYFKFCLIQLCSLWYRTDFLPFGYGMIMKDLRRYLKEVEMYCTKDQGDIIKAALLVYYLKATKPRREEEFVYITMWINNVCHHPLLTFLCFLRWLVLPAPVVSGCDTFEVPFWALHSISCYIVQS